MHMSIVPNGTWLFTTFLHLLCFNLATQWHMCVIGYIVSMKANAFVTHTNQYKPFFKSKRVHDYTTGVVIMDS